MKKILKGILLWITALSIILLIGGIDSIVDKGTIIPWLAVCGILYWLCRKYISFRELCTLSGYKLFYRLLG